jgi:hypothetical protein
MRDARRFPWWLVVALAALAGCGASGPPTQQCAPEQWRACTGVGGCAGGQTCAADGLAWGPCDCASSCTVGAEYDCLAISGCIGTQRCRDGRTLDDCVCPPGQDGGGDAPHDAAPPGDGPRDGGGGGDAAGPTVKACYAQCSVAANCATTVAYLDADNYACTGGYCHYLGCNNDAECQTIGAWVCRGQGSGMKGCVHTCSTTADCSSGVAYMDADNYACEAGACRYLGCNNDAECQTIGAYACRDQGSGTRYCVHTCSVAADCSSGVAYADADNYACEAGVCRYTGCISDTECQALGAYVCR